MQHLGGRVSQVLLTPWRGQKDLPEADALLFHAHAIVKATTCPACGRHKDECRGPANEGRFDVDVDICHATAALEVWRKGQGKDAPEGALPYVVRAGESGSGALSQAQMVAAQQSAAAEREEH